jgi:hypothetical protein
VTAPRAGAARLVERPDFRQLVGIVATAVGLLPAWVEKDYWVVRTLQAIADATALSGQFVFKGGTSLSKAWRLIDRFSEDIDLLLTGPDLGPMPTRSADRARLFKAVRTAVEEATPLRLPLDGLNEEDKRAYYFRSDTHGYMRYPLNGRRLPLAAGSEEWLLVEAGFRGGSDPSTVATFGSYLGDYIASRPELQPLATEYAADVTPIHVPVLGVERTFIEKLLAIHTAAVGDVEKLQARHYYDLSRLVSHPDVGHCLDDPKALQDLLAQAIAVSNRHWGATLDVATLDLSASPALTPTRQILTVLEARWRDEETLYPRGQPSLRSVLDVLADLRSRLQHSR